MKNSVFIILIFIFGQGYAQKSDQLPVKQGKEGIYVLLSGKGFSDKYPLYGSYTSVVVLRSVNNDKFKEIGQVTAAKSPEEFEKLVGRDALQSIAGFKKLSGKPEAWQYVQSHPDLQDYGLLALNLNLGVALGAYYLDKEMANVPAGSVINYKFQLSNGRETLELTAEVKTGPGQGLSKPFTLSTQGSDSIITIKWALLSSQSPEIIFGHVYAKEGNPSEFKMIQKLLASKDDRSDTIRFTCTHFVKPGIQFQYYIRPVDIALQEGPASDTVIVTSVNMATLDQPLDLRATDTTNGIFLSWTLSQQTNARKSVIIERTANMTQAFQTIAVLPASATQYTDLAVQPSFTYYYRIRIATIGNTVLPPSSHVAQKHELKIFTPEAPRQVSAFAEKKGVRISWSKVNNPDVAGYFVTRNNGMDELYEPVSLLIQDTTFLDTVPLYGRNNYTWAVRTYTFGDRNSEPAYSASVRVNNDIKPQAPSGMRSFVQPGVITIQWDDVRVSDTYVTGYKVYRKKGTLKPGSLSDVKALKDQGFELAATITDNSFRDEQAGDAAIQYAVTSVDRFGQESEVGFVEAVQARPMYVAVPEQFSVRKTSKGITIDWDIVKQEGVSTYTIYKRGATETTAVKLSTVDIAKGTFTDTNVKPGVVYYYSLSASGTYGTSERSAEKFAKF